MSFNFICTSVYILKAEQNELTLSRDYGKIYSSQWHLADLPMSPES